MSLRKLVRHFAGQASPPILLDDIRDWFINNGHVDHLWFIESPNFSGLVGQYTLQSLQPAPYASQETLADVYYATHLDLKWRRVVCCKELLHIFDGEEQRTFLPEHVEGLTAALVSHGTPEDLIHQIAVEYANFFNALAVLVPLHLLEAFEAKHSSSAAAIQAMSDEFQIPVELVPLVLVPQNKVFARSILK